MLSSSTSSMGRPFTRVPLRLPRSFKNHEPPTRLSSAWRRETALTGKTRSWLSLPSTWVGRWRSHTAGSVAYSSA
jgi:hypothetical protein